MKKHNCEKVRNCKIEYEEDRSSASLDLDVESLCLDINFCCDQVACIPYKDMKEHFKNEY